MYDMTVAHLYMKSVKRINPKGPCHKEKKFFNFSFYRVYMRSWTLPKLIVIIILQNV